MPARIPEPGLSRGMIIMSLSNKKAVKAGVVFPQSVFPSTVKVIHQQISNFTGN